MSIFEYDEELHMRQEREESKEAGREEGREEERQRLFVLSQRMIKDGLSEEISRLVLEPEFLASMYEKYNL